MTELNNLLMKDQPQPDKEIWVKPLAVVERVQDVTQNSFDSNLNDGGSFCSS